MYAKVSYGALQLLQLLQLIGPFLKGDLITQVLTEEWTLQIPSRNWMTCSLIRTFINSTAVYFKHAYSNLEVCHFFGVESAAIETGVDTLVV